MFTASQWYRWKAYTIEAVPFGDLNPPYVKNPKYENPKPTKILGFINDKSISSIVSDVEKIPKFNGTMLFQMKYGQLNGFCSTAFFLVKPKMY